MTNSKTSKNGVTNAENAPSNQHHPKVTSEVTSEVIRLLNSPFLEARAEELMMLLHIKHKDDFRRRYIVPALKLGFIERTQPDSPPQPHSEIPPDRQRQGDVGETEQLASKQLTTEKQITA